jgi:methionyl-tRNA formyltransferase
LKTVNAIAEGNYPQIPQEHITDIKHAPKIFKETCVIDWSKDVEAIYNFIRGLSPYPAAFTMLNGKVFKIFAAEKHSQQHEKQFGTFETDGKTYLRFYCANGWIEVKECQLEGKKKMTVEELLRGFKPA